MVFTPHEPCANKSTCFVLKVSFSSCKDDEECLDTTQGDFNVGAMTSVRIISLSLLLACYIINFRWYVLIWSLRHSLMLTNPMLPIASFLARSGAWYYFQDLSRSSSDFQDSDERGNQPTEAPTRSVSQDCKLNRWTTQSRNSLIVFPRTWTPNSRSNSPLYLFQYYASPHRFRCSHRIPLLCICFRIALHSKHQPLPSSLNGPQAIEYMTGKHHSFICTYHSSLYDARVRVDAFSVTSDCLLFTVDTISRRGRWGSE